MENSNMFSYIANKNPQRTWLLLEREEYKRPKSKKQLAVLLADLFKRKESSHKDIALLHPDKDFILIAAADKNNMNFAACCPSTVSAEGDKEKKFSEKTLNIIIISGASILIALLIGTMLKNK